MHATTRETSDAAALAAATEPDGSFCVVATRGAVAAQLAEVGLPDAAAMVREGHPRELPIAVFAFDVNGVLFAEITLQPMARGGSA